MEENVSRLAEEVWWLMALYPEHIKKRREAFLDISLAGPPKLPLAFLQFCEKTSYVIPQEQVSSCLTFTKTNLAGGAQKSFTE